METKAYMYILECRDGSLYTGYTTNIEQRLEKHNSGKGAKYTRSRLPVKLIYQEAYPSKEAAMSAEALFKKKKRAEKLAFLAERKNHGANQVWGLFSSSWNFPQQSFRNWRRCRL